MQRMIRSIFILCLLGSFTVVSAQLPPEIRVDAYLLQAEQSIQDGDHNRARDAMQNIHNLQEQHGLDLSDEFHFRYAKAADVLDMPDQALESVVKYLAVSGREGQHYLEALALMNMAARFNENLDILKVLIDAGADLNARDHNDHTPLYFATEDKDRPDVAKILRDAGATQTKITGKSQGDGFRTATALIGAAAIAYAGKDSEDQEAVAEAAREYMEGVLKDQPVGNENNRSVATPSQTQGGQAQDSMQQALQNVETVR